MGSLLKDAPEGRVGGPEEKDADADELPHHASAINLINIRNAMVGRRR
jgi:hypothetical protein